MFIQYCDSVLNYLNEYKLGFPKLIFIVAKLTEILEKLPLLLDTASLLAFYYLISHSVLDVAHY